MKGCITALALAAMQCAVLTANCASALGAAPATNSHSAAGEYLALRARAARTLSTRADANSLATAAALKFASAAPKITVSGNDPEAVDWGLDLLARAGALAPQNAAIAWLHLQLCAQTPACDVRDVATVMRWLDADNGAAWMATLAAAQKDRDAVEVDRVLADMAQGSRFDLYFNEIVVLMFDALKSSRRQLPAGYAASDWARFVEVSGIASMEIIPPFASLLDACRESAGMPLRRDVCLKLARIMQRSDTVAAQMAGFGIERRLLPPDSKEAKGIAQTKHLLEWRVTAAAQVELPLMPWTKNARARTRLAQMRLQPREEDVCIAILREHRVNFEPAEDHK
ncbi:MAG: hypothetical protein ACLPV8_06060 [Steroidobacteraceae bacterium]